MDDDPLTPEMPPHTYRGVLERVAKVRRNGHDLRFTVTRRTDMGYELAVKYVDTEGEPQREWLSWNKDREALQEIAAALGTQRSRKATETG